MNIFNTSIKSILLLFIFLFPSFIMAQSPVILDKITSLDSYKKLYETNTFDHNNSYFKSNDKGQWNNIPIKEVYFYEDYLMCSIDTSVKNTAKRLASYLEKTYPDNLMVEEDYSERIYKVATRDFTFVFTAKVKEGKEIVEDTRGELKISFNKVFDNPLANISDQLKVNKNGLICQLQVECYNVVPAIFADGVPILSKNKKDRYSHYETVTLNKYILNPEASIDLSFIITPGIDDKGNIMTKIPKKSYAKMVLEYVNAKGDIIKTVDVFNNEAYVTDTIVSDDGTRYSHYIGTEDYTKKDIRFNHQLTAPVDYKLTGWSKGKDLRKEKNLEQQIKQFYADYAALILSGDINKITSLLYDFYQEKYTYNYNSNELKSYDEYENLEFMLEQSFKVVTAQQTKLYISNNGQLAYLGAVDKTSYLKAVGLDYVKNISFLFYIDNNTNELKIVR
ncbi:hypothetical protein HMPREF9711_00696 [Myroides odoratimimus CCUG 3837]|uniref:hypothetical protein n=1 Tax=Myroides odoratimimus TaxID=76832 RepID=UPI000280A8CB|nr:hypothetical protein [Myroides odoratimimus]EKB06324.1 hypothetical protein HMPREF9711_00696 [Myroides odoratimimus CCUG 3837]